MIDAYSNYEWFLKQNFKEFAGKWLAIIDKKIVASGTDLKTVVSETKEKYPNKKPLITKIRDKLSIL